MTTNTYHSTFRTLAFAGVAAVVAFGISVPGVAEADGKNPSVDVFFDGGSSVDVFYDKPYVDVYYDKPYVDVFYDEPYYGSTDYSKPYVDVYYDKPAYDCYDYGTCYEPEYYPGSTYYTGDKYYYDAYPSASISAGIYYQPDTYYVSQPYYYEPEPYYSTVSYTDYSYDYEYVYDYEYEYEYDYEYVYDYCSNIPGTQNAGYDCYPEYDHCPNIPGNQNSSYDCNPVYDYCPNIPGNQPSGYDCYPEHDYCSNIPGNQPSGYDCYPDHNDEQPVCDISAEDSTIEEGDSTELHWTSENATSATLSTFGSVSTGGSRTVHPNNDTTYTLRVRDNDGDEDVCQVTVRVEEDNDDNDEDPWCRLTASDRTVDEGDETTLEWDTRNADYASINQGVGRVDEDGGEEDVEVDHDTTFRMTVRDNDGDEETCSVTVRVDEENNFSSVRFEGEPPYNPPVVYLSDIPYTGLDDIDPAVLSFWVMLIALMGAGTWFAYTKGLIPSFALSGTPESTDEGHAEGVHEGHTDASPEAEALLTALTNGDTNSAIHTLRDAAVHGTGVEAVLEAAVEASSGTELHARLASALEASRMTGIRGAKEALTA